ncbi:hypothetical protein ABPG74_003339 [Tetrahymena malaccensis]
MGNCCQKRKEKPQQNELVILKNVKDIEIVILKGNICNENIDCIVNWVDCFLMNERTYILKQALNDKLKKELDSVKHSKGILTLNDCFSTSPGKLQNTKKIIHSTLPLWRGGHEKELQYFEESITQCIQLAINQNMSSIGFTQDSSDIFGIPLQDCAEILIQSFYRFATFKDTSIKKVYFIHQDQSAIQVYKNKLLKIVGEPVEDIKSVYSDKLKEFYFSNYSEGGDEETRKSNGRMEDFDDLEANNSSHNLVCK